ncbi:MAG: M18 family aminopeptidase, partial [Methylococcales bacterium]|nr:M18 family aminopeptidase [Methylococcales bacterium]
PGNSYTDNGFLQLGVEVYGGMLMNPWFDRDLSMAGRVTAQLDNGELKSYLINFKRPIATIPSLAIHLDRKANKERTVNAQQHLPPVLCRIGDGSSADAPNFKALLIKQIESEHGVRPETIFGFELSLYDTQAPAVIGLENDFIASARLDNLLSTFVCTEALTSSSTDTDKKCNRVIVLSDHEEVGSKSTSGASGPFLESVLRQLCGSEGHYRAAIDNSMLISVDNAHSVHPNYSDKHEPRHMPLINDGPVIKVNHNQRYATNSETQAVFAALCQNKQIPYQQFVVRSDLGCGSTIGPISATELGVRTLDIGVPQLGMHSIRELAGTEDVGHLHAALSAFMD